MVIPDGRGYINLQLNTIEADLDPTVKSLYCEKTHNLSFNC